jgi:peptide deformylase
MEREILLLGDARLYEVSAPVGRDELEEMKAAADDLRDTLFAFRKKYGVGRAIAAPQIDVPKRLIYLETGELRVAFVNPRLTFPDDERMTLWDDCMSFPNLLVRVSRYKRCRVDYFDLNFQPRSLEFEGDLSELIQHEYDHLDGILATMRAVDSRAFSVKPEAVGDAPTKPAIRYKHTNLIASDWQALSGFYRRALGLTPTGQTRDLSGEWIDRLTGMPGERIRGEHLKLPGTDETLEMFSYNHVLPEERALNRAGFSHIAFEVEDVPTALQKFIAEGGAQIGEVVTAEYPGGVTGAFVYAADPEGNLIELQSWKKQ